MPGMRHALDRSPDRAGAPPGVSTRPQSRLTRGLTPMQAHGKPAASRHAEWTDVRPGTARHAQSQSARRRGAISAAKRSRKPELVVSPGCGRRGGGSPARGRARCRSTASSGSPVQMKREAACSSSSSSARRASSRGSSTPCLASAGSASGAQKRQSATGGRAVRRVGELDLDHALDRRGIRAGLLGARRRRSGSRRSAYSSRGLPDVVISPPWAPAKRAPLGPPAAIQTGIGSGGRS